MRIAIVGSGIAGLYAASQLSREHDVTLFESNDYAGGHTNTIDVDWQGRHYAVDTGFIVFNDWTYPNFMAMLRRPRGRVAAVEHELQPALRTHRPRVQRHFLNSLFAQRRNLFRPSFLRMIADILRFNKASKDLLAGNDDTLTLGPIPDRE